MSKASPNNGVQDGGWGWLACLASFWTNGVVFGIVNSFGVLFVTIIDKTGGTAFQISWIGSICGGLTFFMAPFASLLTNKIGCRPTALIGGTLALVGVFSSSFVTRIELMYITYGVILGLGFGIAYQPSLVILGVYFDKKLGIANGLATFGSAVFTVGLPFALKKILERGLQECLWFESALVLVMLIFGLTFRPVTKSQTNIPENCSTSALTAYTDEECPRVQVTYDCKANDISIWRERNYRIWTAGVTIGLLGYFVPFCHLIKHVNETIPDAPAEVLIICLGATSGVGRLVAGFISDYQKCNPIRIQQLAFIVIGICTILVPVIHNFAGLCVLLLTMGLFDGAFVSVLGVVGYRLVGPERASQAIGVILGLISIPMMIGPPVAGIIYDIMGNYDIAFICAGVPPILGACILFLIHPDDQDTREGSQSSTIDLQQSSESHRQSAKIVTKIISYTAMCLKNKLSLKSKHHNNNLVAFDPNTPHSTTRFIIENNEILITETSV